MATNGDVEQHVKPAAVAERIGVPEKTLREWRYLGKGPAYRKVGALVRYRWSDVERWLNSQTRGGAG